MLVINGAFADHDTQTYFQVSTLCVCVCVCVCCIRDVMVIIEGNGDDEFKSKTKLFAFYLTLMVFGKIRIQSFSFLLWENSQAGWPL